eukprot:symbB.v1.2.033666.t1/scaffold4165.1/size44765/1
MWVNTHVGLWAERAATTCCQLVEPGFIIACVMSIMPGNMPLKKSDTSASSTSTTGGSTRGRSSVSNSSWYRCFSDMARNMRQESAQMTRLMDRLREVGYDELGSPFSTRSTEASSPGEDLTESPDTQKIKAQLVDMHRHLKLTKKMYRVSWPKLGWAAPEAKLFDHRGSDFIGDIGLFRCIAVLARDEMQMIYFNLFLTITSGLIALLVALVELLGLPNALGADLQGRFWTFVDAANDHFELLGIVVVSIFVSSMLVALCCYRRVFRPEELQIQEGVRRLELML